MLNRCHLFTDSTGDFWHIKLSRSNKITLHTTDSVKVLEKSRSVIDLYLSLVLCIVIENTSHILIVQLRLLATSFQEIRQKFWSVECRRKVNSENN